MMLDNFRKAFIQSLLFVTIIILLAAGIKQDNIIAAQGWGLLAAEIMLAVMAFFYLGFERLKVTSREIALIAVLGAAAAAGRIALAAVPGVQPVTFITIISGFVLGPRAGFMVGSTAALVSNFFLGQGPWSPWQMFAWGLAGAAAGALKKLFPGAGLRTFVLFNFIWGYVFGWVMNLWFWTSMVRPLNWQSFIATYAGSFWFDTMHAVGNAVFYVVFGAAFIKMLKRFHSKMTYREVESVTMKNTGS
jgi:energy-coupling factor transport system substrate-specific component